jgi:hypothetical protein
LILNACDSPLDAACRHPFVPAASELVPGSDPNFHCPNSGLARMKSQPLALPHQVASGPTSMAFGATTDGHLQSLPSLAAPGATASIESDLEVLPQARAGVLGSELPKCRGLVKWLLSHVRACEDFGPVADLVTGSWESYHQALAMRWLKSTLPLAAWSLFFFFFFLVVTRPFSILQFCEN